jgi:hypothetical protein
VGAERQGLLSRGGVVDAQRALLADDPRRQPVRERARDLRRRSLTRRAVRDADLVRIAVENPDEEKIDFEDLAALALDDLENVLRVERREDLPADRVDRGELGDPGREGVVDRFHIVFGPGQRRRREGGDQEHRERARESRRVGVADGVEQHGGGHDVPELVQDRPAAEAPDAPRRLDADRRDDQRRIDDRRGLRIRGTASTASLERHGRLPRDLQADRSRPSAGCARGGARPSRRRGRGTAAPTALPPT